MPTMRTRAAVLRVVVAAVLALGVCLPAAIAADASRFAEGRLFRVAKPGIRDSFVFGTIHAADDRVSTLPAPAAQALVRSRLLAMELTPVAVADDRFLDLEQLEDGARLEPLLGAETYDRVVVELTASGTPEAVVARLKPWAAMMKMSWGAQRGDGRTLDENLLAAARARRIAFTSLESLDEQVAAFDAIPLA